MNAQLRYERVRQWRQAVLAVIFCDERQTLPSVSAALEVQEPQLCRQQLHAGQHPLRLRRGAQATDVLCSSRPGRLTRALVSRTYETQGQYSISYLQ